MIKKIKKSDLKYIILFAIFLFLCFLFPYSGDDWAWGSQIGIERLQTWFEGYSGRYLGNLIVLALTRSNLLKTVAMSVTLTGIVYLIERITKEKKIGFYITVAALILMPSAMLSQSIVWTAGFSNYTTSIFFTLIYVSYIMGIFKDEKPIYSPFAVFPLFILGICNALIVEHITIYNILLAIGVIGFTLFKHKKIYWQHVAYFIGAAAGAYYMFSSSVYKAATNGNDDYRALGAASSLIHKVISNYLNTIAREGFLYNLFLNVLICIFCFILLWETTKKAGKTNLILMRASFAAIFFYTLYSFLSKYLSHVKGNGGTMLLIDGIVVFLFIMALLVFMLGLPLKTNEKLKLLFFYVSAGATIAPLLIVSPIGSRCLFASYIFFVLLGVELIKISIRFIRKNSETYFKVNKPAVQFLRGTFSLVCIGAFAFLFFIYGSIYASNQTRIEKARTDVKNGETSIEIENLPYTSYMWTGNPTDGTVWETRFKLFYGIDKNVDIKNTPYKVK